LDYQQQLQDPRWKHCREQAIDAKGAWCERCGSASYLNVHHKRYQYGLMAWEYSLEDLEVLCRFCHEDHHGIAPTTCRYCGGRIQSWLRVCQYCVEMARIEARENLMSHEQQYQSLMYHHFPWWWIADLLWASPTLHYFAEYFDSMEADIVAGWFYCREEKFKFLSIKKIEECDDALLWAYRYLGNDFFDEIRLQPNMDIRDPITR